MLAGETIDRAARLLDGASASTGIVLDEVTAGLLGARFEVLDEEGRLKLERELELDEEPRTLLGKATPCVGRDREIGALEATFAECTEEPVARAVLVTASAGAGKSRLRNEVLARLRSSTALDAQAPAEIWVGRGDPMRAGSPFAVIGEMLRRACHISEAEPLEVRQKKLRERVARRVASAEQNRVTEFLGEIVGAPFPDRDSVQLRTARQDAMLMSDQVRGAWLDFVGAECKSGPVVLVLEDLHWGDLPTVKLVDAALRDLANGPLMVLAFARPEVHDIFPKLWEEREVQEVRLGGLTKKAAERLVREVLGADVAADTVANVIERADGNAFYLEELIRAVAEGRGSELPETVVAMVEARLAKLDPEARRVLRAGSVFGQTFWKGSAGALLGGQARLTEWLRELTEQELVSRRSTGRFPGEEEFAFRHALLRDGAYAMLTDDDKKLGHVLAGVAGAHGGARCHDAGRAFQNRRRARALPAYRARPTGTGGNDLEGARFRAPGAASRAARRAKSSVFCAASGRGAQLARRERASARARDRRDDPYSPKERGRGSPPRARRSSPPTGGKSRPSRRHRRAIGNERGSLEAQAARGMALAWGRRCSFTPVNIRKPGDLEQLREDRRVTAGRSPGCTPSCTALRPFGHFTEVIPRLVSGWRRAPGFEQSGDLRNASITRADLGFVFLEFGSYAQAERLFRQSLVEAERMGLLTSVAQVKQNLGLALLGLGKLEEAASVESEAARALHAQGQKRAGGLSETYLARISLRRGAACRGNSARQAVTLSMPRPQSSIASWPRPS